MRFIYYTTDGTTEPSNNTADPNIKQYDPAQKFKVTANTAVDPAVAATTTVKAVCLRWRKQKRNRDISVYNRP